LLAQPRSDRLWVLLGQRLRRLPGREPRTHLRPLAQAVDLVAHGPRQREGLVEGAGDVVGVQLATLGEGVVQPFAYGLLQLRAREADRARGEVGKREVLGVAPLLLQVDGQDLLADGARREVHEEDLVEAALPQKL